MSACSSSGISIIPDGGDDKGFVENQPRFVEESDDTWFHEEDKHKVTFRVLITENNYQVRQLHFKNNIKRKLDSDGDREQNLFFKSKSDKMNFKNWDLNGIIEVKLNSLTRQIEHVSYILGETPKTWQASIYFQEDLTRYQFDFPSSTLRKFRVEYKWRILKEVGLNPSESKEKAIEYLKTQTRR